MNNWKNLENKLINILIVILSIAIIGLGIFSIFFDRILIEKNSMYPTVHDGEIVTIYKTTDVKVGDIIVFDDPEVYNKTLIKRVIGCGGDEISIDEDGLHVTTIDGNTIDIKEDYINPPNVTINNTLVPDNMLYVLGDNRGVSYDSSEFGFIRVDSVLGRVINK